ncbi:MAG: DUF3127 domain-containing protein [Chlorobium sp.]|jgi:hypothetical protein|nr:DUF3127 domain-containing protein [Chlorobium sp.]
MQITAKLLSILPEQTGAGKNGPWKKQDIIVETEGQYPKKVSISLWGEKHDRNLLKVGVKLNISFDIESREFNGKWYTDVKAWKIEGVNEGSGGGASYTDESASYAPPVFESDRESVIANDDCPF